MVRVMDIGKLIDELMWPVLGLLVLTAGNFLAVNTGWAENRMYFVSLFVGYAALTANKFSRRAAITVAVLAIPITRLLLSPHGWCASGLVHFPCHYELVDWASMIGLALLVRREPVVPDDPRLADLRRFGGGMMPFVSIGADGKPCFWVVVRTGDWLADVAVGVAYARILLEAVRTCSDRPPMGWIIRDMIRAGQWSGVECGFTQYLSKHHYAAHIKDESRFL